MTEVDMIARELDLDMDIIYRLQDANDIGDLFKYILVKQCNKLGEIMPVMFETIQDDKELLLPDNLLSEGSVIRDMIMMIEEQDWTDQVEIIGWLYQYYISEKKDEVFAGLRKNKKIAKENIPAATQLFTPKWIVQYMVENSLGRLWLESHPNEELKQQWKYYLEEAEQKPKVVEQLVKIKNKNLKPEEIKILDPCVGSGHILVYAFDVLYEIYKTSGYSEGDIPRMILENNLYGLDIDDRAAQLAYFALLMKACRYNRRILESNVKLNICSIQESNNIKKDTIDYFINNKNVKSEDVEYLVEVFEDAKEYGSILNVEPIDFAVIEARLKELEQEDITDLFAEHYKEILLQKFPPLIQQVKIMSKRYDVVVTNPPYMGVKGMGGKLGHHLSKNYPLSKSDLFAVFMEKLIGWNNENGYNAAITKHTWMFLSVFENLRKRLLHNIQISSMLHLGSRAFEEISGEVVQTTAFVIHNRIIKEFRSKFIRLTEIKNPKEKSMEFFNSKNYYETEQNVFSDIPCTPISYWISMK